MPIAEGLHAEHSWVVGFGQKEIMPNLSLPVREENPIFNEGLTIPKPVVYLLTHRDPMNLKTK